MTSFADFLSEGNRAEKCLQPYLLNWVKMFARHAQSNAIHAASMNDSLYSLNGRYPTERLLQAKRALQLYSHYRARFAKSTSRVPCQSTRGVPCQSTSGFPRQSTSRHINAPATRPLFLSWEAAERAVTRTARLRHLSWRTEKAYLSWIRQFKAYVQGKACGRLTEEDVKSFLSFLAVEKKVAAATQRLAFNALCSFSATFCASKSWG